MSKNKTEAVSAKTREPESFNKGNRELSPALVDEFDQWLAAHYTRPEDLLGKDGLLARLTKRVVERALGAEFIIWATRTAACRRPTETTVAMGPAPRP